MVRTLIAPVVGGALYARFGFRGPFVFAIIFAAIDLLGRLLLIERKEVIRWGHDPQHYTNAMPSDIADAATAAESECC